MEMDLAHPGARESKPHLMEAGERAHRGSCESLKVLKKGFASTVTFPVREGASKFSSEVKLKAICILDECALGIYVFICLLLLDGIILNKLFYHCREFYIIIL